MRKLRLRAPSPALIVSLIALFVALGGTTYAAVSLPKNSVGARQLKKGAVTPPKVARKTIALFKGQRGLRGPAGPTGPQGPGGAQGLKGDTGPVGPSSAYFNHGSGIVESVSVPAGDYTISGQGIFGAINTTQNASGYCTLQVNATTLSTASGTVLAYVPGPGLGSSVSPDHGVAHLAAAGTISNTCVSGINTSLADNEITAVKVGSVSP